MSRESPDDRRLDPPSRRKPDTALLAAGWGSLWGLALGEWLLAPAIANAHFVHPRTTGEWIALTTGLGAVLVGMGVFLSLFAGILLVFKEGLSKFRDRVWAYGLATGPLIIAAYAVDSLLIHWMNFRSLRALSPHVSTAGALLLAWLLISACFARVYTRLTTRTTRPRPERLAFVLVFAGLTGAAVVPLRILPAPPEVPALGALNRLADRADDRPLLFIGLDSGTWRVLDPLIASGAAPHLRALAERGIRGDVEALWPPYWSGAAWAAIVTGFPQDVTGVYEELGGSGPGLPPFQVPLDSRVLLNPFFSARYLLMRSGILRFTPPPRALLNGRPFWQLLHEAGVPTAVVRFRFTYPATGQGDIVVSDWVGHDQWELLGVRRDGATDIVAPTTLVDELLAPFAEDIQSDEPLFAELLPGPKVDRPADAVLDPFLALRSAAGIDRRTFEVSELILKRDPRRSVLAIYLDGFDAVAHAFWQYRFPEDFQDNKPAPSDVERLGPVIDRYVRHLDHRLGKLLALYAKEPDVLIVSDHGHGPTTFNSNWRGWHTQQGIFLLAGPQVSHSPERIRVSYYDVAPTVLHLKHFEKPVSLRGSSVLR